jgi:ribosomal protein S12 methylthiotransferase accessory factor
MVMPLQDAVAPVSIVETLVSPLGPVSRVTRTEPFRGLPELTQYIASAGQPIGRINALLGAGQSLGAPSLARLIAIAEAAERYAGDEFFSTEPVLGTAAALPGRVADLNAIPQCSESEYANPSCPLVPFDKNAPISWVAGVELCSGDDIWIPCAMISYCYRRLPAEHFWYPVSTGYAAHTDMRKATFSAIAEVIERDAAAVAWLQKLPLPRLPGTALGPQAARLAEWAREHFIDVHLFDATTDLELPVVYAILRARHDDEIRTSASCATGLTLDAAAVKALSEGIGSRHSLTGMATGGVGREVSDLVAGARAMAAPEMADAFGFLLDSPALAGTATSATATSATATGAFAPDEDSALARIVGILRQRGLEAIAVDRTTTELAAAGLVAVVVVVPRLQPLSLSPFAQFRASERLYQAPRAMGYRVLPLAQLNENPQPLG